ncbi:hypothetical protein TNCV_2844981 [Trichonephila clavipes]|nr:hypothetical protein TNCV_2844981 [Trichonephila clavipes]
MIQQFFLPALQEKNPDNGWLQPEGATVHTSWVFMGVLKAAFPERLISLRGDINQRARLPDLPPPVYFIYSRAIGNGPGSFEPWSSDENDNCAPSTRLLISVPQQWEDV